MASRHYMPEVDGESPCTMCANSAPSGGECIASSSLCSVKGKNRAGPKLREWWITHVKGAKQPENKFMKIGKREHERIEREAGVTRDLEEVFEALSEVGGKVTWTARLCSRYLGIRGEPDIIESERVAPDKIKHVITEVKSHPSKRRSYWNQAVAYGLMMSYRGMLANGLPFYDLLPINQSFSVDVDFKFYYYKSDFKPDAFPLVRDWKFVSKGEDGHWPDGTPYGAEYIFGFKKTRQKFSGIRSVKNLSDLPKCAWCFPKGTPVITNPILKPIENIKVGDTVLTHNGRYRTVEEVFQREHEGKLIKIDFAYNTEPVLVTPEHPFFTMKGWLPASQLDESNCVLFPVVKRERDFMRIGDLFSEPPADYQGKWSRKEHEFVKENYKKMSHEELAEKLGKSISAIQHYCSRHNLLKRKQSELQEVEWSSGRIPIADVEIDKNFCRLIGYYLAEGCVIRRSGYGRCRLNLSFSPRENDLVEDATRILKSVGVSPHVKKTRTATRVAVTSMNLGGFFNKYFGCKSSNHQIPPWVLELPREKQREILIGYWAGDGYFGEETASCSTVSPNLAQGLVHLFHRFDIAPSLRKDVRESKHKIENRAVNQRASYVLKFLGRHKKRLANLLGIEYEWNENPKNLTRVLFWSNKSGSQKYVSYPIDKVEKIDFSGKVYDIRVSDDSSFCIPQAAVHNCPPIDSPKSTLNNGNTLPRDLCWAWKEYCSSDLPKKNHKQMNLKAWKDNGFKREKTLESGRVVRVFDTGKRSPGRKNHPEQYAVTVDGEIVDSAPRKDEILQSYKKICQEG